MSLALNPSLSPLLIPYPKVVSRLGNASAHDEYKGTYGSAALSLSSITEEDFEVSRYSSFSVALIIEISWGEACLREWYERNMDPLTQRTVPLLLSSYRRLCNISQDTPVMQNQTKPLDYRACLDFARTVVDALHPASSSLIDGVKLKQFGYFASDLYQIKYRRPL